VGLRLWTSPDAAPDANRPGGQMMADQLEAFEAANAGVTVEVRVKKPSGIGGLLDFLRTATVAAPAALPDVIALSRDDLATAVGEGLLRPMGSLIDADSLSDMYPMAMAAAQVGDELYGVPFSADATVLAYNTEIRDAPPVTWTDVLSPTGTFVFPAGDPLGLVTLHQYLALGGGLTDEAGHLALDAGVLAQVLDFYHTAAVAGVVPPPITDYADSAATWIAYREHRATLAATPASLFLRERERAGPTAATVLPTRDGTPLALGSAWSYALVTSDPARQAQAAALLLWLTAPDNLAEWTLAAGVLPPRASALDAWNDPAAAAFGRRVMSVAVLRPDAASLAVFGPAIRQAVTDSILGRATPQAAAERAAAAVAGQ